MKKAKIVTVEDALKVLRGAGVIIDEKKHQQFWTVGVTYSEKAAKAGKVLDSLFDETTKKPVWHTTWVHTDRCACRECTLGETTKVATVKNRILKDKEREASVAAHKSNKAPAKKG